MKAVKYSFGQTDKIDLGTKIIFKYPAPTSEMDIAKMVVKGRHPKDSNTFVVEHECRFVIYVLKGKGKVYAGENIFDVKIGDVIFVPTNNKFAVEGDMEYITVDIPAYFQEQSEEVQIRK